MKYGVFLVLLLSATSQADIYKCVNSAGQATYSSSSVCQGSQAYSAPEPVLEISIKNAATDPEAGLMSAHFTAISLGGMFDLIADYAGVPLIILDVADVVVDVHLEETPWHEVFDDLAERHDIVYRQAYGSIYLYEAGSLGESIVMNPDLLRWYQNDKHWDQVIEHDQALSSNRRFANSSVVERTPHLIKRVKTALREPLSNNAAEHLDIQKSFSPEPSGSQMSAAEYNSEYLRNIDRQAAAEREYKTQLAKERREAKAKKRRNRRRSTNCVTHHSGSQSYTTCN